MIRIRTKLVLFLLMLALLPIVPLYFLVKSLLQQSLEVGFNQNVELALDNAIHLSQALYGKYKDEALAAAVSFADSAPVRDLLDNSSRTPDSRLSDMLGAICAGKLDVFDNGGNLIYTKASSPDLSFQPTYRNLLEQLRGKQSAEILPVADDPSHLVVFAPVATARGPDGFVLVTRVLDSSFTRESQQVLRVQQMFKTLDFLEKDLSRGFILSFVVIYVPIALLCVVVGYTASRKITSPLLMLVNGTKQVAAGNWDHQVQVSSNDEIGELVSAFNTMIRTLKEQQDQVVALEKMVLWREIARVLAHEIKNPLTPIQLTAQQMRDKYPGDDPQYKKLLDECAGIIGDEIGRLKKLAGEFSDFARMPKLHLSPGSLNELIEDTVKLYSDEDLVLKLTSDLPAIEFDYENVRRVIINLIENAVDSRSDPHRRAIIIKSDFDSDWVTLRVVDQGEGITPDLQNRIFEPYFSTKKSGMGLGLAIVRKIVEEHGGRIDLESVPGEGTEFTVKLPLIRKEA